MIRKGNEGAEIEYNSSSVTEQGKSTTSLVLVLCSALSFFLVSTDFDASRSWIVRALCFLFFVLFSKLLGKMRAGMDLDIPDSYWKK